MANKCLLSVFVLQFVCTAFSQEADFDTDRSLRMQLQYSTDLSRNPTFELRGQIKLQSLRSAAHQYETIMFDGLHGSALYALSGNGAMYRLKVLTSGAQFLTYLPANSICGFFREKLMMQLDPFNQVVAVNYAPQHIPCSGQTDFSGGLHADTDLLINYVEQGPQPDTASYVQRMEQEKASRETGEVKDNRSFIAKYWMYVIPVVIFFMMSGASGGGEQAR